MWFESAQVELVRDAFPDWMAFLFALLSYLGSIWLVAPAVVLAFWFGNRYRFASWIGILMGGYAIMVALKGFFSIPRPAVGPAIAPETLPTVVVLLYAPAVEFNTTSFPSGHAIAGTIFWTMFALESDIGTRRTRLTGAAAIIGLVGFARVGAGVHYPVDVAVGTLIALFYLAVVLSVRERARTHSDHVATSIVFVCSTALSLAAFGVGGHSEALALFGGCLGALLAWQYVTPPAEPWPVSVRGVLQALLGFLALPLIALVLLFTDWQLGWLLVGVVGSVTVVGLPRTLIATESSITRSESTG